MTRRATRVLVLLLAVAVPTSAQTPPSVRQPIEAAKRQANRTSSQINAEQKAGNDAGATTAGAPASATHASPQSGTQKGASPAKSAQAAGPAQRAGTAADRAGKAGQAAGAAPKARAAADSGQRRGDASKIGPTGAVTFYRETYSYDDGGRRDPFLSLMATGELRPMISDLTLVGIIYDETGRNSIAILVDASAGGQSYRKKVGDVLGRLKITKISEKDITLNVDEFGFARQETLLIDRKPRTGARRPQ